MYMFELDFYWVVIVIVYEDLLISIWWKLVFGGLSFGSDQVE